MRSGNLRHRITIQQKSVTRGSAGGEVIAWVNFATAIHAEAEPLVGREFVELRAAQADLSLRFRMRYMAGINPAMRVLWDDGTYNIVEVIDIKGLRRELHLMCSGAAKDS